MIKRSNISVAAILASAFVISAVAYAARSSGEEDVPLSPSLTAGVVSSTQAPQQGESAAADAADNGGKPQPAPQSAPLVATPPVVPPTVWPSDIISLTGWYLTLPVDTAISGAPDVVMQPQLAQFALSPYFRTTDAKDGVVFQAHAGGKTTANSSYPRSELREMTGGGKAKASWSNTQGTHSLMIRQAITHVPSAKPEVVAGQIHDASDDVIMIRLEGSRLFVESDGENIGDLDTQYKLGTVFTVYIETGGGRIRVSHNGALKVDYAKSASGLYFKAGCYTQSNVSKGDNPQAYGEVIIYELDVTHS